MGGQVVKQQHTSVGYWTCDYVIVHVHSCKSCKQTHNKQNITLGSELIFPFTSYCGIIKLRGGQFS